MIDTLLSYAPGDLLLFSDTVYWRLFERMNAATWPAAAIAPPVAAALLATAALWGGRPWPVGCAIAACWAAAALAFLPLYREINWAVAYVAPFFWLQSALLIAWSVAARAPEPNAGAGRPFRRRLAWALGAAATLGWPLLSLAPGRSFAAAQVVGLAPDPTALATLAAILLCARGAWTPALALAPFAWCAISAGTLLALGASEGWALIAAAALALAGLTLGGERPRRQAFWKG